MGVNHKIVVAVFGVGAIAMFNSVVFNRSPAGQNTGQPISKILLGTYVLLLLLGLLDIIGGVVSQIAGGIALLALLTMALTQIPWGALGTLAQGGGPSNQPPGTSFRSKTP